MKILPANSEGCWLFIFVIFLSFGFAFFCHSCFVVSFFCHLLSHFFVIFLSFFCRFLVVFYFLALFIFLSFSHKDQASGEGGKPGLGNAKNCKKWLPVWEMQKKCQKNDSQSGKCKKNAKKMTPSLGNAKKMQKRCKKNAKKCKNNAKQMPKKCEKNDSRAGKVAFLEFPGRPRFSGLSRPPGPFHPAPGFWAGPAPRAGRQLLVQAGPKTNSPGQAPLPYPSSPPAGFPRVSPLVPCIWCCHEITKGLSW